MEIKITKPIKIVRASPEARIPAKAHSTDAGFDLYSTCSFTAWGGERSIVDVGIQIQIPEGYFGMVCDRSGLSAKHGITTQAGIIDQAYTGNIRVILYNTGIEDVDFKAGDRIAQLLILPVPDMEFVEVESLEETTRGEGGFGSSGR